MLDLLESFRIHAAGRPLLIALAIAVAFGALARWRKRPDAPPAWIGAGIAALAITAIPAYAASVAWYASDDHYFDAAEPTMTIVGWLVAHGQPLYHDPASAERYAHIYGPLAFVAHGAVQRLFGAGIETSKWLGAAAGLIGLVATWLALAAVTTRRRALVLTGGCALVYLAFRNYTFWTRPDALLVAGVAIGQLVAARTRGVPAAIGLGLVAGLLANLKFTGPIYAAPLLVTLSFGARPALLLDRRSGGGCHGGGAVRAAQRLVRRLRRLGPAVGRQRADALDAAPEHRVDRFPAAADRLPLVRHAGRDQAARSRVAGRPGGAPRRDGRRGRRGLQTGRRARITCCHSCRWSPSRPLVSSASDASSPAIPRRRAPPWPGRWRPRSSRSPGTRRSFARCTRPAAATKRPT